eukprot:8265736-Lingulodinium_polyedra.AAC.1
MECENTRFANRRDGETPTRPRHDATFAKRITKMRSNRRFIAVATRNSHARALHVQTSFWPARDRAEVQLANRCDGE